MLASSLQRQSSYYNTTNALVTRFSIPGTFRKGRVAKCVKTAFVSTYRKRQQHQCACCRPSHRACQPPQQTAKERGCRTYSNNKLSEQYTTVTHAVVAAIRIDLRA
jgi:hypothetical protein